MPRRLIEEVKNWAGGINTSASADALPPGVSPRGKNTAFTSVSPNPPRALIMKRRGGKLATNAVLSGEPTILGQFFFEKTDGTTYHILVNSDGSVRKRNQDGTDTIVGSLTAGNHVPYFAAANDYLFITNGIDLKKFNGTTLQNFGIAAPTVAPTLTPTGAGGVMPAGTWEVLISYYNQNSGHEGPRSAHATATITAGQKLQVSWPVAPDSQITHVFVYLRQTAVGANFYRGIVGATPAPDAATGGFPVATTSTIYDISSAQYEALKFIAPAVGENVPPPAGAKAPTWHRSRMFVHDGANVYFSDIEKPESFNLASRYEPINPDDGDTITGLHSAHDLLLILKDKSSHAIDGDNPSSWLIKVISPTIGAVNHWAVASHAGATYWWDALAGPVEFLGQGSPIPIGIAFIGPTIDPELLAKDKLNLVRVGVDSHPARQRIMFAVPELGKTRATLILPWNTLMRAWESDGWNPFDVASMAQAEDADGTPYLYIGGYSGKLFQWWTQANDGVPTGATSRGKVTAATTNTLTCTKDDGTSPGWTANALKELYVYAISQDGLTVERRRILVNTGDVLVVETWGTLPNNTYTFVVGGIDFQFDTPWVHSDVPFFKKRFEFLFVQVQSALASSAVPAQPILSVEVFRNYDLNDIIRTKGLALSQSDVYDTALFDSARFASSRMDDLRLRISKTGRSWRARLRNIYPDEELVVLKIGMQAVLLTTKS